MQIAIKKEDTSFQKLLLEVGLLLLFALLIAITILLGRSIIIRLKGSLRNVHGYLSELAQGNVPLVKSNVRDETEIIVDDIDTISRNLSNIKYLAEQIGEGKFETNINIFNNEGDIGASLRSMRDGLKTVAKRDRTRNWTNEGFALFAEILRDTSDVQALYDKLVKNLVKYVEANQGGIFIATPTSGEDYLELKSCYAYNKKKYIQQQVELGQGLVGQCWQEGNTIYLLEVPEDYVHIGSGLGEENPRSVLIVPIKVGDETYGVIELASFSQFTPTEKEFVEGLGEDIASTISSIRSTEQTQNLLRESREITHRMVSQEEQMRSSLEELAETQEELEYRNAEMGAMMEAIQKATVVMEFDAEGNFTFVNKRFSELSQYKSEEVVGQHRSFFAPKDLDPAEFNLMWSQLTEGMHLERNVRRIRKDGKSFWLRAHYFPVISTSGDLIKVTSIATDITEKIAKENKAIENQKTVNYRSNAFDKAFIIFETDRNFIVKNL
ncbi:MAG: PAS domain S-box protein, partial [Bacteroidota bacterium]